MQEIIIKQQPFRFSRMRISQKGRHFHRPFYFKSDFSANLEYRF